ncbi:hypothetical protein PILCRDRAFT_824916 [Piloderma croceum F 1598]|uniref:Uncharacterized protein n=1 Tax=Piloderma croceum (strain F 1598) TaxID=765440 RepID=A0A0C3BKQ9_PILCF|nr:hypothetical protein PILCRDRAFT_824916 [Piloderma croceum F 1598]
MLVYHFPHLCLHILPRHQTNCYRVITVSSAKHGSIFYGRFAIRHDGRESPTT